MAKLTMTATDEPGVAPVVPAVQVPSASLPGIGTIESVRQEIEDAYQAAEGFHNQEPDEVIRLVSGHAARLSHIRTLVGRYDGNPYWRKVRSELSECLEELREQFQYASRLLFSRDLDYKIESGGRQT